MTLPARQRRTAYPGPDRSPVVHLTGPFAPRRARHVRHRLHVRVGSALRTVALTVAVASLAYLWLRSFGILLNII